MGSPEGELGHYSNETQHQVTLTRAFLMHSTEITQEQFQTLMGYNPTGHTPCDNCPADSMTWHEAAVFCNEMSACAGLPDCYQCMGDGDDLECQMNPSFGSPYACPGYRMPTEAEWEYSARAGTTTATYVGDLDDDSCSSFVLEPIAWYCGHEVREPQPVASMDPNPWGLYDMLGNVVEMCTDRHAEYPGGATTDPVGDALYHNPVIRGGRYFDSAVSIRAAARDWVGNGGAIPGSGGFRVVRSLR